MTTKLSSAPCIDHAACGVCMQLQSATHCLHSMMLARLHHILQTALWQPFIPGSPHHVMLSFHAVCASLTCAVMTIQVCQSISLCYLNANYKKRVAVLMFAASGVVSTTKASAVICYTHAVCRALAIILSVIVLDLDVL